jgi:CBS domain
MANKGIVASLIGVTAGLLLATAYFGAPYAGVQVNPTMMTVAAAAAAFAASVGLLSFMALHKPAEKKPALSRKLRDLDNKAFAHFPTGGVKLELKPDSVIEEWDIVRNASAKENYADRDILLTIKKSKAKQPFNPSVIRKLFNALKLFQGFIHITLVNEHDEFVGYMPAAYARLYLTVDGAETQIVKYIADVLANPDAGAVLRDIRGFSRHDTIFDHMTVRDAQKKVTEDHLYGLVVFKDKRNRKPLGVIYEEDLVKLTMEEIEKLA